MEHNPINLWSMPPLKDKEYTGGSVDYYKVVVKNPTSGNESYIAECNDIIEALGMDYAEGNAFKALWRIAAARRGLSKRGYEDGLYDAEKVVFFGERLVTKYKAARQQVKDSNAISTNRPNTGTVLGGSNFRMEAEQMAKPAIDNSYLRGAGAAGMGTVQSQLRNQLPVQHAQSDYEKCLKQQWEDKCKLEAALKAVHVNY